MVKNYPHKNFSRTDIINSLIKKFNYNSYLEIGTRNVNDNYNAVIAPNKECIDPNPAVGVMTYKMTSDAAFKIIKQDGKSYDLIFIDGLHLEDQVNRDIENSLAVLNKGGTIIVHDCNPISQFHARPYEEYLKQRGHWNGTVWRSIVKLRLTRADLEVCVVDTDWGCGIIRVGSQNLYKPNLRDLSDVYSYGYLERNRKQLLNLISVAEFKKRYM